MLRLGWTWWDYVQTPGDVMRRLIEVANKQADDGAAAARRRR